MPLTASSGYTQLVRYQTTGAENPPITFPPLTTNPSTKWSFAIWVKKYNTVGTHLIGFNFLNGSNFIINSDANNWYLTSRNKTIALTTHICSAVVPERWTLLCFAKEGSIVKMYRGLEDLPPASGSPAVWTYPVSVQLAFQAEYLQEGDAFFSMVILANAGVDICNFKFWNDAALTADEFRFQMNGWNASGTPAPIWASPLRVAGDITNIANPTALAWTEGHTFIFLNSADIQIPGPGNIVTGGSGLWKDPQYMSFNQPCPTWLKPTTDFLGSQCYIDPGTTPLVITHYKAPQFYEFKDVGSVPPNDSTVQSIRYYGAPFNGPDPGQPANNIWGLYKDENDVEISNTTDTTNSFFSQGNSGVIIPSPVTITELYRWKFGAEFTWQPVTPQVPTSTSVLYNLLLFVNYIGFPQGVALLSEVDLSGLFILNRSGGPHTDIYNRAVELKIPDPTIRTAYIGE